MNTYEIDLSTVSRGNNFKNALDICKRRLAGKYDPESKTWTVEATDNDSRIQSLSENYCATVVAL